MQTTQVKFYTDNQSLFNSVHSVTYLLNKRFRVDMAILHEMMQKGEIDELKWISSDKQLADVLTKAVFCEKSFASSPRQLVIILYK